jgi:hypothetical protein
MRQAMLAVLLSAATTMGCAHGPPPDDAEPRCLVMSHSGRSLHYSIDGAPASSVAFQQAIATVPSAAAAQARSRGLESGALASMFAGHALSILVGLPLLVTSKSWEQAAAGGTLMAAFPLSFVALGNLVEASGRAERQAIDRVNVAARDSGHCPP